MIIKNNIAKYAFAIGQILAVCFVLSSCLWGGKDQEEPKEIVGSDIEAPASEGEPANNDTSKKEKDGLLGMITSSMKSGVKAIGDGVGSIADTTLSAVGLNEKKEESNSSVQLQKLDFQHIAWGEIPYSEVKSFEGKNISIIRSLKEMIDFKSRASNLNSSKTLRQIESINFKKEVVLVVFTEYQQHKEYSNVTSIYLDQGLHISRQIAVESEHCNDYVQSGRKGISYQLISAPISKHIGKNLSVAMEISGKLSICPRDFGNYSQLASSKKIPFKIVEQLMSKVDNSAKELNLKIFKNKWGGWDRFKSNYCTHCSRYENEVGFPSRKTLVSFQKPKSVNPNYKLALNSVHYISGYWYLDVTAKLKCRKEKESDHQLIEINNADIPDGGKSLALDRIIVPGPFIPVERNSCK
jgi:hypothetical protein